MRVDGAELRVKVVGEGGNLGLTQRGRIEFARSGGKINTDAIDNSAGVDCSDHEVNIKILLDWLVAAGELDRGRHATRCCVEMTDEVAELVLADNRDQNAVLGIARAHAPAMLNVHAPADRATSPRAAGWTGSSRCCPTDEEIAALRGRRATGLTSPELATLLAHAKLDLKAERAGHATCPTARRSRPGCREYFPTPLRQRFPTAISAHPLRREIVTTQLVNEMVDGAGMTYAFRLGEELAAEPTDAVRAYAVTTAVFDLPELWPRTVARTPRSRPRCPTRSCWSRGGCSTARRAGSSPTGRSRSPSAPRPPGSPTSVRLLRRACRRSLRGRELADVEARARSCSSPRRARGPRVAVAAASTVTGCSTSSSSPSCRARPGAATSRRGRRAVLRACPTHLGIDVAADVGQRAGAG